MDKILNFIADSTSGSSYKSFKYCFESIEVPSIIYDDKQNIVFSKDNSGETDKGLKTSKSLEKLAILINQEDKPLFKYFLDGSRRTYKVDDIAYDNRIYPIIAGQIGVGCCERKTPSSFKNISLENYLTLALPACANKDSVDDELFFNSLIPKLNNLSILKKHGILFKKILSYSDKKLKEGEKYATTIPGEFVHGEYITYYLEARDKSTPQNIKYFGKYGSTGDQPTTASGIKIIIQKPTTNSETDFKYTPILVIIIIISLLLIIVILIIKARLKTKKTEIPTQKHVPNKIVVQKRIHKKTQRKKKKNAIKNPSSVTRSKKIQ